MARVLARHQRWRVEAVGLALAFALPLILWHDTIGQIASGFHLGLGYLVTGWGPWLLMLGGIAGLVPIVLEDVRARERRCDGSPKAAWFGWATTLYLLGFGLATQDDQIADRLSCI